MPSLIYIARIKRSSDELIQGLQAAGFHVESFKPGEITADECLLVMTSEAVDAKIIDCVAFERDSLARNIAGFRDNAGHGVESR